MRGGWRVKLRDGGWAARPPEGSWLYRGTSRPGGIMWRTHRLTLTQLGALGGGKLQYERELQ